MSELTRIEAKLDQLSEQVALLTEAARKREELFSDFNPILKDALGIATLRLAEAEEKGYFAMGKGVLNIVDRIVQAYSPEDLDELGDNVVAILDMIRALTQPDVTSVISELAEATEHPERVKPVGLLGAARATREDDAKQGLGVMLELVRRLGRGVHKAARRRNLAEKLGSRRTAPARKRAAPLSRPEPQRPSKTAAKVDAASAMQVKPDAPQMVDGVRLTNDGFLEDPKSWNMKIAEQMARSLGFELSDSHRLLIERARAEFAQTQSSPNIRRLTIITGLSTKELYQMFPKSPGKCAAMIAGLPKPAGCI